MKTILVILDGLSEEKIKELNNKSPLEYAKTPTIDKIISIGGYKKTSFNLPNREPDSLSCILSILGVGENKIPVNRAYLEALAAGIKVNNNEVVLRCNLVSVNSDRLESFNGKGLTNSKMELLSKNLKATDGIKFFHLKDYRNLLVMKKDEEVLRLKSYPPHEYLGAQVSELLKDIDNINSLKEFVNNNRFTIGNRSYMFYPWGVAEAMELPSFLNLHNKTCSCVCGADIVKGIAKAMKMNLAKLNNSTGDVDTDLKEKARAVLNEIQMYDVVLAHINGTDEVSHRMDLWGKIEFIEKIDKEFLSTIYEGTTDTKIIILSDHQTSCVTGKHERGLVDFIYNF